MKPEDKIPIKADEPTMCSVCAWRADCKKKFQYAQGSPIKCAEFTRDAACKTDEELHQ